MKSMQFAMRGMALLALSGAMAEASSVGITYADRGRVIPASAQMPVRQTTYSQSGCATGHCATGQCANGTCGPVAGCHQCQRLGFACVDHASPCPCTADGACTPKRESFGWYQTRWRTWPGADYGDGPSPAEELEEDSLLAPYETPRPEEEDQQAPPPIEDAAPVEDDDPQDTGPAVEVNLPPLPQGRPEVPRPRAPRPEPPRQRQNFDEPPALPFGQFGPELGAPRSGQASTPPAPFKPSAAKRPTRNASSDDGPPPLPASFSSASAAPRARLLPTVGPGQRYDPAVRAASATGPAGAR